MSAARGLAVRTEPRRAKSGVLRRIGGWWPVLLLAVCLLLVVGARRSPALVERYYSRGFYPVVARVWGGLTSLSPVSIAELCILAAIAAVPVVGVVGAVALKRRGARLQYAGAGRFWRLLPRRLLQAACLLVSAFILFCGLNYYRPSYAQLSGLVVRDSSTAELEALCAELTERANALAAQTSRNALGVTQLSQSVWSLCREAREVFGEMAGRNELLPAYPVTPKPVLASGGMSMAQITGVFCPITFEANINTAAPAYSIAATACHELAHTRGFMREDEANFLAYLACSQSGRPEFEYSGVMLALVYVQNQLLAADYEAFRELWSQSSPLVRVDFAASNEYWARYDGVVADVSTSVNNTYLRMNNQQDGVQSYGRMVDLLLADYRLRQETAG